MASMHKVAYVVIALALMAGRAAAQPDRKQVSYKPGHWMVFHGGAGTKLRVRLILEPMFRYGHASTQADDTVDMIIRRGRVGFDAKLPHDTGMRVEISIKNMHFEIHNMYLSWKPQPCMDLQFGFIKAPGGLERDTFSFDQPFIERSTMTFLNFDHEVGVKLAQDLETWRWAAAIARDPPPLAGGDPEDSPQIPSGVESEDIYREAAKWNSSGRVVATPSDAFEAGIRAGLRYRPDAPDFGQIAVEPYDTTFLTNRPYRGLFTSISADAALVQPHWKAVVESGVRRDGEQLAYPDGTVASETSLGGHLVAATGYLVLGYTPDGVYGPAVDAAPLRSGWEIVSRVQFSWVKPVDQGAATLVMGELGVHWEVMPQLRLQTDLALEKFGDNDITLLDENRGGTRLWAQVWAVMRL
jgi:hypothetical protein